MNLKKFKHVINNTFSFGDFKNNIVDLSKKEKGDMFELLTKYIFLADCVLKKNCKNIYLYDEIPCDILKKLKLPSRDKGIDLLIVTHDSKYIPVQCKYRSDTNLIIPWNQLSTFFGMSFGINKIVYFAYFITNTYEYCDEINDSQKIVTMGGNYFDNISKTMFENIRKLIGCDCSDIKINKIIPFDYQKNTIILAKQYFENNKNGYLEYICGAGKTLTSYFIAKNYRKIIIFVPSLLLLSQFYNEWVYAIVSDGEINYNVLLVGSNCDNDTNTNEKYDSVQLTTDEKEIKNFWMKTKMKII